MRWKGGGREQAEQAIAAARWASRFSSGQPCYARKLAAAAALFYEIIMLHPLVDGNKWLATLVLNAFLARNSLPRPGRYTGRPCGSPPGSRAKKASANSC
ncbi:Fic family protein [Aeropyrum pernix]|uniref:Fic family protein n=1 Tax=Aeropyrum pernix TaxID=56636 RepID=UPI001038044E